MNADFELFKELMERAQMDAADDVPKKKNIIVVEKNGDMMGTSLNGSGMELIAAVIAAYKAVRDAFASDGAPASVLDAILLKYMFEGGGDDDEEHKAEKSDHTEL